MKTAKVHHPMSGPVDIGASMSRGPKVAKLRGKSLSPYDKN